MLSACLTVNVPKPGLNVPDLGLHIREELVAVQHKDPFLAKCRATAVTQEKVSNTV